MRRDEREGAVKVFVPRSALIIFRVILPFLVVSAIPSAVVLEWIAPVANRTVLGVVAIVMMVGLTAAAVVAWFRFARVRVVVRPDAVEFHRAGRCETWTRSRSIFQGVVVPRRIRFLTFMTRAVVVEGGERPTRVALPMYTRAMFNDLMAEIAPIHGLPPAGMPGAATRPSEFTIDATPLRRIVRRRAVIAGGVVVGFVVLAGVLLGGPLTRDGVAMTLILVSTVPVVILVGVPVARDFTLLRSVPTRLAVAADGVHLGDALFRFTELERIWVSPPRSPWGCLRLDLAGGRGPRRLLAAPPVIVMTPRYDDLVHSIRAYTAHLPGLIRYDFG